LQTVRWGKGAKSGTSGRHRTTGEHKNHSSKTTGHVFKKNLNGMNATNERMCNETSSSSSNSNSSNMKPQQQHKLQTTQLTQTTSQRIAQKLPLPLGLAQPTTPPAPMAALFPLAENPFEPHFLDTFLAAPQRSLGN